MRLLHLHFSGRYIPERIIKVNLRPFRVPELSRTRKEQGASPEMAHFTTNPPL
jgi:hypothetical protein